jgi:hypothetical protein
MMASIPQVATAMQTVLTTVADQAAYDSDFVLRESKLTDIHRRQRWLTIHTVSFSEFIVVE